jgi:hypothetical protein
VSSASSRGSALRIVVLGLIVRFPLGGMAWHHLQYAMGLARLGHDVTFLEDSGDEPWSCYDPKRGVTDADPSYGLRFAASIFDRVGLGDRWAYYDAHRVQWHGPLASEATLRAAAADVVLNLSGSNVIRPWLAQAAVRAFVDTDPAFTQVRNLTDSARRALASQHNAFFTFGENFGAEGCEIPDDGFPWVPTRQPIVLDAWPVTAAPRQRRYTTVMQWDSYPAVEYGGSRFGMKSESFEAYADLPSRSSTPLELALGSPNAPRAELSAQGWLVTDPLAVTLDPWTYQRYLAESRGEFAVAKHGYVSARAGWFSERSAAYLASARPAVVQDTGFGGRIPAGEGVLTFSSPDEAVAALADVEARYSHHARAAREVAEQYFDSDLVLQRLLDALP